MNNLLLQYFGPVIGRHMNTLTVIGFGILLAMLVIFLLDANTAVFLYVNRISEITGTALWANITTLGEGLIVLSLAGLVAIRWPAAAWAVLIGGIVGTLIVHGLKEAVGALRPAAVLPEGSFHIIGPRLQVVSFPSGHTATITAFAVILFLHARNRWASGLLFTIVVLVGVSRLAVGAHWPLDVLAGWLTGMIIAVISLVLAERLTFGLKLPAQFSIILLSLGCAGALFWIQPNMIEAVVLRWIIGTIGMVAGLVALTIIWRRQSRAD
jgi:membrane-associated phospholipid phosphatase